jgi:PAS domain-containing protein
MRDSEDEHFKSPYVERPLKRKYYTLEFQNNGKVTSLNQVNVEKVKSKWSFATARRLWSYGFKPEQVAFFLESMPAHISAALANFFALRDIQLFARAEQIKSLPKACGTLSANQSKVEDAPPVWLEEDVCGYLKMRIDPATQRTKHLEMNAAFSQIMGIHSEELIARFANSELEIQNPNLDFLCFLTHETMNLRIDLDRFYRVITHQFGGQRKTTLICNSVKRHFDSEGRIVQVCRLIVIPTI